MEGAVGGGQTPDSVYQLVRGDSVLRHDPGSSLRAPAELATLLLAPPLLGFLWYISWRWRYPDVARQARKRRSRAAQNTLRAFRRLGHLNGSAQADQMQAILTEYLRQRFELTTAEPTPEEVARYLERTGQSTALALEMARLFADCDAARFAPRSMAKRQDWSAAAKRLVLALEDESWSSQRS